MSTLSERFRSIYLHRLKTKGLLCKLYARSSETHILICVNIVGNVVLTSAKNNFSFYLICMKARLGWLFFFVGIYLMLLKPRKFIIITSVMILIAGNQWLTNYYTIGTTFFGHVHWAFQRSPTGNFTSNQIILQRIRFLTQTQTWFHQLRGV